MGGDSAPAPQRTVVPPLPSAGEAASQHHANAVSQQRKKMSAPRSDKKRQAKPLGTPSKFLGLGGTATEASRTPTPAGGGQGPGGGPKLTDLLERAGHLESPPMRGDQWMWPAEKHANFQQALRQHGRQWGAVGAACGVDADQAQAYFLTIKAWVKRTSQPPRRHPPPGGGSTATPLPAGRTAVVKKPSPVRATP
jgi:hypothetical protein